MDFIVDGLLQGIAVLLALGLTALVSFAAWRIFKYKIPADKEASIRRTLQHYILQAEEKYLKREITDKFHWVWGQALKKFPGLGGLEASDIIHQEIPKLAPLGVGLAGKDLLKKTRLSLPLTGPGSGAGSATGETGGPLRPSAGGTGQ